MLSQAVILCGGLGTRLGELTASTPKPMLEVAGRPFLDHLIQETARYGFSKIVLLAGRFGEKIVERFDAKEVWGSSVKVIVEPEPFGTGGALRFAYPYLDTEFVLLNGDSWISADLTSFASTWTSLRATSQKFVAQMLLHRVPDVGRFGSVVMNGRCVVAFREKNSEQIGQPGLVNAGVYALSRSVVSEIPPTRGCSLEKEVLPSLVAAGQVVAEVADEGAYFTDIGVPESFARAQVELSQVRTRPAVFFDRDGTLNQDFGYTHRPEDLVWMPGAREAVAYANALGYFVFVVTNQAGVARGYYDEAAISAFHRAMQASLFEIGAHIDGIAWCPHHPQGNVSSLAKICSCRKPAPGMLLKLLACWPIDKSHSLVVGDSDADVRAAEAADIRGVRYVRGSLLELLQANIS